MFAAIHEGDVEAITRILDEKQQDVNAHDGTCEKLTALHHAVTVHRAHGRVEERLDRLLLPPSSVSPPSVTVYIYRNRGNALFTWVAAPMMCKA